MGGWVERIGRMLRIFRPAGSTPIPSQTKSTALDPQLENTNLGVFALSDAEMAERKIVVTIIGELELPTSEIVACDPLITGLGRPAFSRKVRPGRYQVALLEAQGRIAAAVLCFGPGLPVRWELASFARDRPSAYGSEFIVDDAVASFMDKSILTMMSDPEELDDYLADVACSIDRFCVDSPIDGNPLNVAMFDTGFGDGAYRSFCGLDAAGEPLLLMTDFEVLENADGRKSNQAN
ncbi:DUF4241 domain-containing protein [Mesorhizobium sp. INR15]|uniref:DUF4241 domain-containing protein n=1 Tax=Mesorhizobium sp. INR15 TaxID=2654248 RepID=UPI0018969A0A|nr:DUF4241 domain-containing protein [Mesorhizobium sp. INR15]QPC90108.1 DUF4241 domain-containing protein [Mesorhizobium sp. INR15]